MRVVMFLAFATYGEAQAFARSQRYRGVRTATIRRGGGEYPYSVTVRTRY